jgi:uroporphyrinogen-III decarboxylase
MIDMYRCPDKLLAACQSIQDWRFAEAVPAVSESTGYRPRAFMALHRGSDGFMSKQQFERFYWPGLRQAILKVIELGYTAAPFFEGVWDDRLEYLLDLPKGKVIFWAERTDLVKAKRVLGKRMCIQGGVPPTLLQAGSPQDVEEHVKKLIKTVGKGGGLIVGPGSAMDYARPENVRAMVDTVKKYGQY